METEKALQLAESLLKDFTQSSNRPEVNRIDLVIDRKDLKAAVKKLKVENHWGYLAAITGIDNAQYEVNPETKEKTVIPGAGALELLYHFCEGDAVASLRVSVPYDDARVDSIYELINSVTLYEREAAELFGIEFIGTPSTERLVLPDSWPEGVFPLRKAFKGFQQEAKG